MINTVDNFKKGDSVTYVPTHAAGDRNHSDCENGFVTSKNDTFVFVRFSGSTSQACAPEDLVSMCWRVQIMRYLERLKN